VQEGVKTLFVAADAYLTSEPRRTQIIAIALRHGIATCMGAAEHVRAGAVMSYGDMREESYRQFGISTGRILGGAKPSDIPVVEPTRFEFVINLITAKTLGLSISKEILLLADDVIE
jgi:putative ABC transport system substrate-binding protein